MDAFITNSNAKSIVYNLDINNIDPTQILFKIEFRWFSAYEIRGLLAFKLLYENPEKFFSSYRKRKSVDTKQYVFEGKLPSYHLYPNCTRLLSSFHNYKIPEEIKARGDLEIQNFRVWFIENKLSMETNPDFFLERMRLRFNLTIRPEVVDYENSGVEVKDNLNLDQLEFKITQLIEEANDFYIGNSRHKEILDLYGKFAFIHKEKKKPNPSSNNYSDEEIWETLKIFDNKFKSPIISMLREFYRVKFNPEIKFEGQLLEQLGFVCCNQGNNQYYLNKSMGSLFEI